MDKDQRLRALKKRTDRMDIVKILVNKVMASGCYSEKNEKLMIDKGNALGDLTDPESELIHDAFVYRREEANAIRVELHDILEDMKHDKKKENRNK